MQKIQKNAYILLWSIFLSLIIWISFLSISSQIAKNLKENSDLKNKINTNNKINNKIVDAIEKSEFNNIELNKNELIIFEKSNHYNIWLKEEQEIKLKININSNMTIKINNWSWVYYFNTTDSNINWTVINVNTFLTWTGELIIKNLWGYSNMDIMSEENFLTENKKFEIIKKVWNKNVIKQKWEIKLF